MAKTKKLLGSVGVPALCGHVKSIRITAEAAAQGVLQLSDALNQSVSEIEVALNDLPSAASISIPSASSWQTISPQTSAYKYYYDITVTGIDNSDLPIVVIAPSSLEVASACGFCPTCESFTNKIRVYAKSQPTSNITVSCWVIKGN